MAKLTQILKSSLVREILAREKAVTQNNDYEGIPPVPNSAELTKLIEGTRYYRATTARTGLEMTNYITFFLPEFEEDFTVGLTHSLPIVKQIDIVIGKEWLLSQHTDTMSITNAGTSERTRINQREREITNSRHLELNRLFRNFDSTTQLLKEHPGYTDLPSLQKAIEHEKTQRANLKARKKAAAPLQVIEVKEELGAIAKARLLGAKYVT